MYIDLSVPINEQLPVYPGDPATVIKPAGKFETDGFRDHYVSIGTHVGTHVDAPAHMLEDGTTLDTFPVDRFIGRGFYIKIEGKSVDLNQIKQANIQPDDIVLFHTGMSQRYQEEAYFNDYPTIPVEVATYLVGKKIKMLGVDMCSVDHEVFDVHKTLLSGNVLIIENLVNLDKLAGKNSTIYALPINLQVDGAPARVIAQIN